ncbi:HAD family hydrolase, partial [uncultured Dubosiella sp.]
AAMHILGNLLGIRKEEMAAVGDNYNDLSMIRAAGLGAGVANTVETMKPECDVILETTNDEDAIADLIRQYVL